MKKEKAKPAVGGGRGDSATRRERRLLGNLLHNTRKAVVAQGSGNICLKFSIMNAGTVVTKGPVSDNSQCPKGRSSKLLQ